MPEDIPLSSTPKATQIEKQNTNNHHEPVSLADELIQESERLRELSEKLRAREKYLVEMEAEYPYFKEAVYTWLMEKVMAEPSPIPDDVDLETWAKEQGAVPLEDFIDDL